MPYFQWICFFLGGMVLLSGLWIGFCGESYKKIALRFLPEKRSLWILVVSLVMFAWIVFTWYQFFQTPTAITFIVTFIFSLSLIKLFAVLFKYQRYREFALRFLEVDATLLKVFAALYFSLGACLIAIGLTL